MTLFLPSDRVHWAWQNHKAFIKPCTLPHKINLLFANLLLLSFFATCIILIRVVLSLFLGKSRTIPILFGTPHGHSDVLCRSHVFVYSVSSVWKISVASFTMPTFRFCSQGCYNRILVFFGVFMLRNQIPFVDNSTIAQFT